MKFALLCSALPHGREQMNSLPKLLVNELKLCNLTHSGIDFLQQMGLVESSNMWKSNRDYLAEVAKGRLLSTFKSQPFVLLLDKLDKQLAGRPLIYIKFSK